METSPKAPCYFLSPNCFWCVCACVFPSPRQQRGKQLCNHGWCLVVRHPQGSVSAYLPRFNCIFTFCFLFFFFCFFHVIHFHFQIRYDRTPAQYTASRMSRHTAPTAFRFMSLRAVLMQSELGQRQISAHS